MKAVHVNAVGPLRISRPAIVTPRRIRLGGKPWGDPRYGARFCLLQDLPELCEAIDAAVLNMWPDGPPPKLRHPIQHDAGGRWFYAGAPADEPPELYRTDDAGEVLPWTPTAEIAEGTLCLVSLAAVAYQTTPWACGTDLILRGCMALASEPTQSGGMAAAFAEALERRAIAA